VTANNDGLIDDKLSDVSYDERGLTGGDIDQLCCVTATTGDYLRLHVTPL